MQFHLFLNDVFVKAPDFDIRTAFFAFLAASLGLAPRGGSILKAGCAAAHPDFLKNQWKKLFLYRYSLLK
jgi:hypothetical protein